MGNGDSQEIEVDKSDCPLYQPELHSERRFVVKVKKQDKNRL